MLDTTEFEEDGVIVSVHGLPLNPEVIYQNVFVDENGNWLWCGPYYGMQPMVMITDNNTGVITFIDALRYSYMTFHQCSLSDAETVVNTFGIVSDVNPEHLTLSYQPNIVFNPFISTNNDVLEVSQDLPSNKPENTLEFDLNAPKPIWDDLDIDEVIRPPSAEKEIKQGIKEPNANTGSSESPVNPKAVMAIWAENYRIKGGRFYVADGRRVKYFTPTQYGFSGQLGDTTIFWNPSGLAIKPTFNPRAHLARYLPKETDLEYRGPTTIFGKK